MEIKRYKFIKICDAEMKNHFLVFNLKHGDLLGEIGWYRPWRKYCFCPQADTMFTASCLNDIADFMNNIKGA